MDDELAKAGRTIKRILGYDPVEKDEWFKAMMKASLDHVSVNRIARCESCNAQRSTSIPGQHYYHTAFRDLPHANDCPFVQIADFLGEHMASGPSKETTSDVEEPTPARPQCSSRKVWRDYMDGGSWQCNLEEGHEGLHLINHQLRGNITWTDEHADTPVHLS